MNYQYSNNPVIRGSTEGTPINLLRKDLNINNDMESNYSVDSIKTSTDIRQLVDEINSNIKEKKKNEDDSVVSSKSSISNKSTKINDNDTEIEEIKYKKKYKKISKKTNILEDSIYDGILLLIIFILMSQHFVKSFIGNYINIINVNAEGIVPFTGVVTYGIIFVAVFLSARLLIHKVSSI